MSRSLHSAVDSTRILHEERFYSPRSLPDHVDHPDVARTFAAKTFIEGGKIVYRHTLETVALASSAEIGDNFGAVTVAEMSFGAQHILHDVAHSLNRIKGLHQATLDHHTERRATIVRRLQDEEEDEENEPKFRKEVLKLEKCNGASWANSQHCFRSSTSVLADYDADIDGKFQITGGGETGVLVKLFGATIDVVNLAATITFDQENNSQNRKPKINIEFTSKVVEELMSPSTYGLPEPTKFVYNNDDEEPEALACSVTAPAWEHTKCPSQLGEEVCDKAKTFFFFKKMFFPAGFPVEAEIKIFGELKPGIHGQICTDEKLKNRAQAFGTLQQSLKGYASVGIGAGFVGKAGVKVDIQFVAGQAQIATDWLTEHIGELAFKPTCGGTRVGMSGPGISIQLFTEGPVWDVKHTLNSPKMVPTKLINRFDKECNTYGGPPDDSVDSSCCAICPSPGILGTGTDSDGFDLDSNGCPRVTLPTFKAIVPECAFGTTPLTGGTGSCDGSCYDHYSDSHHCGTSCTRCANEPGVFSTDTMALSFCMDGTCIEKPLDHCSDVGGARSGWYAGQMKILPTGTSYSSSSSVDMNTNYKNGGTFTAFLEIPSIPGIMSSNSQWRFGRQCKINGREVTESFCENILALSENDCSRLGSVWRTVFTSSTNDRSLTPAGPGIFSFPYFVHPNDPPFGIGEIVFDCIFTDEVSNFQLNGGAAFPGGGVKIRGYLNDNDKSFLDCLSDDVNNCNLMVSMRPGQVSSSTAVKPWNDGEMCASAADVELNYDACGVQNGDGSSCESNAPSKVACLDAQPDIDLCIPPPLGTNCCGGEGGSEDAGGGSSQGIKASASIAILSNFIVGVMGVGAFMIAACNLN